MTEISVIIPVYNAEEYISRCLNSVLQQTFQNFEIICINDGSSDSSLQILEDFSKKDSRIKIINQQNKGPSIARNRGIEEAVGNYIYFLDADDCIHYQLFEIVFQLMEKHQVDTVSLDFFICDRPEDFLLSSTKNLDNISQKIIKKPLRYFNKRGKWSINLNVWSKFYRKSTFDNIRFFPGILFEDYVFTIELMSEAKNALLLNEKLYYYNNIGASIMRSDFTIKKIFDYQQGLLAVYELLKNKNDPWLVSFFFKKVFPVFLKEQLKNIKKAQPGKQCELWDAFQSELVFFHERKMICFKGHRIKNYFLYRKLIRRKNKK